MPTAARLVTAIALALLAFIVSGQIMPLMPEGTDFGYFTLVNIAIGVVTGWVVMGKRVGRGITAAITNGITGTAAMVFWGLFVQGCNEMVRLAMRNRYDGPFEAVKAIFEIGFEYAQVMMVPNILGTLLIGGILAGLVADYAGKIWR